MTNCPCCSSQMLRHIRQNEMYWFCRNCWQEMPLMQPGLNLVPISLKQHYQLSGLTKSLISV